LAPVIEPGYLFSRVVTTATGAIIRKSIVAYLACHDRDRIHPPGRMFIILIAGNTAGSREMTVERIGPGRATADE
jgi:hypothetical protein